MDNICHGMRRFWMGVATHLGLHRTTGLGKLKKEVRTCEYSDVQVMWEMLSKSDVHVKGVAGTGDAAIRIKWCCCAF
ncbi:hypothetical protein LUZ63_001404 [Rhynchospora breviuscula]|uniref:Uncharacterized protein n=1 Tax=Rhynchospora breviuscula TaxID=2022672 RepID=A0A9Q0HXJ2_9POAL|nr:hypothetical protein LUZ63_001404 [Rhynchospora breviuscula]